MTGLTLGRDVFATQDIFSVAIMVEGSGLPVLLDVTGIAFIAEPSLVAVLVVIGLGAGYACGFELLPIQEAGVAAVAFGLNMFAAQWIFGVAGMVKNRNAPVFFRVAGLALLAKPSLVPFLVVVRLVAGDAGGLEFLLI